LIEGRPKKSGEKRRHKIAQARSQGSAEKRQQANKKDVRRKTWSGAAPSVWEESLALSGIVVEKPKKRILAGHLKIERVFGEKTGTE